MKVVKGHNPNSSLAFIQDEFDSKDFDLLEALLSQTDDVLFVKDLEGKYLLVNDKAAGLLGFKNYEIVGRTDKDFFKDQQLTQIEESDRAVIETKRIYQFEETVQLPEGTYTFYTKKSPLYNKHGQVTGVIGIARDITQNKEIISKLSIREQQLRTLFEGIDDAIIVHDKAGNIVECNESACRRFGYTKEELCQLNTNDIDDPSFAKGYARRLEKQLTNRLYHCEGIHITKDGQRIPSDIVCSVIEFRNEEMVLSVARDLSALKHAEEERRELERQVLHKQKLESLGTMAGGIAHDFNNLLMGVLGNIDLAIKKLNNPDAVGSHLEDIKNSALRAAELCNQLLAYSGKGQFIETPLNLNDIVSDMGGLLRVSISKKAKVIYNLQNNLPAVNADPAQIRQIILNLLTNASESLSVNNGTITITTLKLNLNREALDQTYLGQDLSPGNYVMLEVLDNGCGMTQQTAQKIFDPFFTTKETGHGLGLASVMGIAKRHNGAIKVITELGEGTRMQIYLPASEQLANYQNNINDKQLSSFSGFVLLVDDEPLVRNVCAQMLQHLGFQVITACDGSEAIEIYTKNFRSINCVLLDLTMPGLSGHETLDKLFTINPKINALLTSGYNEQEISPAIKNNPSIGFIQKPYRIQDLAQKINEVWDRRL